LVTHGIEEALAALTCGSPVIVVDDEDRENESHLIAYRGRTDRTSQRALRHAVPSGLESYAHAFMIIVECSHAHACWQTRHSALDRCNANRQLADNI
jgi:hypothetical protein